MVDTYCGGQSLQGPTRARLAHWLRTGILSKYDESGQVLDRQVNYDWWTIIFFYYIFNFTSYYTYFTKLFFLRIGILQALKQLYQFI